ncbi:MAG: 4-amino-4-deoxy-L-arabinose transferase-like glycosyltransferase, partial [Roseivirga sp.]
MSKQKSILLIVILAIAVNFANIGGLDVYALDEAKNAEAAREMFESGNYVVPYYN